MQRNAAQLNSAMRKYAHLVYSLAYSRTQNHADAEDIFQEVFLRYVRRKENFRDDEHEKAWLIRVTANLSVNLIAGAWRRHVILRAYLPENRPIPAQEACELDGAMKRLADKDRIVLCLRYSEGLTAAEIARALNTSEQAVRRRITRAKGKLNALLHEAEKEEDRNVCDNI